MDSVNLSTLAIVLGLAMALFNSVGVVRPESFATAVRKFPRSSLWGYSLMLLGTAWFLYNLSQESISDFASYKNVLFAGFAAIGIGACIYVRDFLAVRGLAIVLLLLAKLLVDTGRPALDNTSWVLVVQVWAYGMVLCGMWFTISPWRLRNLIDWATANEGRTKAVCAIRMAFGLFVAALGATVFRGITG